MLRVQDTGLLPCYAWSASWNSDVWGGNEDTTGLQTQESWDWVFGISKTVKPQYTQEVQYAYYIH